MIGDKLIITDYHRKGARLVMDTIGDRVGKEFLAISVAGESGCGKSETAACVAEAIEKMGYKPLILGQDDYFKLPPHSNHNKRMEDISWVGTQEVHLDLMDENIAELKSDPSASIEKPLVYFEEDRIDKEKIPSGPYNVVIAEGTYTTSLKNVDVRAFINRDYKETKKARLARGRDQSLGDGKDQELDFLERVLEIEHQIISKHKMLADVVIPPPDEIG